MVATRPITIEEFETLPLEGRWELIDGEPVEMTPSADESSSIGATIITLLGSFVRPCGLGGSTAPTADLSSFLTALRCGFRTPRLSGQREHLRVKHAEASPVSHPISR
jgi:Uma2 family endonuclease